MAEKIVIDVDISNAQAIANLTNLVAALNATQSESLQLQKDLVGLQTGLAATAKGADTAGREIREMSLQGARATGEVYKLRASGISAAERYLEMGKVGTRSLRDVGDRTSAVGEVTDRLRGQVVGWIGGYAGIQGAISLINALIDRTEKAIQAKRILAGERIDKSGVSQELMAALGLTGGAGEKVAKDLMSQVMNRANVKYEDAGFILGSSASAGQDVTTKQGMDYAVELAKYTRRAGLDKDSVLAVTKYAQQQGITDAEGLKGLFAKGDAVQGVAAGLEKAPFWKNLSAASAAGLAKGVDADMMSAIYASVMTAGTSEQDAGNMTRMILALAQGTSEQSRRLMARSAARLGVTSPTALTDDTLESMRARGNADAAMLLKERPAIAREERDIDEDVRRHDVDVKLREAEIAKAKDPKIRDLRTQELALKNEDYDRSLARRRATLAERRRKADQTATELAEDVAYQAIPLQDRLTKVAFPTLSTSDTAEQNQIISEFGGQFQMTNSMFTLLGAAGKERYNRALAAARGATGAQTDTANAGFEETDRGKTSLVESKIERERLAAADDGTQYAELLMRQVQSQREVDTASGTRTGAIAGFLSGEFSEEGYENELLERMIVRDLNLYQSMLGPGDEGKRKVLRRMFTDLDSSSRSAHLQPAATRRATLIGIAKELQTLRGSGVPSSVASPAGEGGQVAAPVPPAEDPGLGPQSSVGWGGGGQTVHIGNYFTGAGGDLDLPGRFDS